jgi:hypothetical protein
MEELLYSDTDGKYFLLDYSPSHSELVIRKIDKSANHNIDLFFKAVYNIQMTVKLEGVKVFKVHRQKDLFAFPNPADRIELYKITDNSGFVGFIDASVFVVFHNELDLLQTSLGDFTWSEGNKEVFSTTIY